MVFDYSVFVAPVQPLISHCSYFLLNTNLDDIRKQSLIISKENFEKTELIKTNSPASLTIPEDGYYAIQSCNGSSAGECTASFYFDSNPDNYISLNQSFDAKSYDALSTPYFYFKKGVYGYKAMSTGSAFLIHFK